MTDDITIKAPHKHFESIKKIDENGIEYWEARALMPILGYEKWSNFENIVIEKAKKSCSNSGQQVEDHFADVGKMIKIAIGSPKANDTKKLQDK